MTTRPPHAVPRPHWGWVPALLTSLCLLLATSASSAQGGSATRAAERAFGDSLGLNVKFSQGQSLADLALLLDLKVKWVRENIWWEAIEPQPGRYAPPPRYLLAQLAFYREHDIGVVALLSLGNRRAYAATAANPGHPYDPAAFARFAVEVTRLLKAEGVRFVLELGNEPHNSELPKIFGGQWNGKAPSPWVDHYVRMVTEATAQVKAFDASIRVLSDDDMWVVHYWFLQAGLPPALDGFAVHPYADVPELTAVAHDTDWTRPHTVVDSDRSFASAVARLREAGRAKLGRVPEVWVTEWGWPVGGEVFAKFVTEDVLAGYLPRSFIVAAAAGVEVVCWFSLQDAVDGPMGLTDNQGRQRKSFAAFKAMAEQLGAYRIDRQMLKPPVVPEGVQAFLFRGEHDMKLAIWTTDGRPRQISLRAESAVDGLGRNVALGSAPIPRVSLGALPIYITGNWSDESVNSAVARLQ